MFWVSNSDRRSLCVRFMKHESTRQTAWHGNPDHPKRSVGGGTLTGVFRMLMYYGFDETDPQTKCPAALRTELLQCIKAHKRSLPEKIRVGEHPSGVWAVDVVLGLRFGFRDYGWGLATTSRVQGLRFGFSNYFLLTTVTVQGVDGCFRHMVCGDSMDRLGRDSGMLARSNIRN